MSDKLFDEVRQAMEKGTPIARFAKAIMGKLNVKVLDHYSGMPSDLILSGSANDGDESAILTFWTPIEVAYFERANKLHIAQGNIVPMSVTEKAPQVNPNAVTDEELRTALEARFFTVQKLLRSFTSPTPAIRMLAIAQDMNKPVGTVNAIKSRVAELQASEYEA